MKISYDRKSGKLYLSQEAYVERILERFNMIKAKYVCFPLGGYFKLSFEHCPTSEKEKQEIRKVSYASAIGSLMYAMICTRPNIAYVVGVVNGFLFNPGKEYWTAVKWIFKYLKGTSKAC